MRAVRAAHRSSPRAPIYTRGGDGGETGLIGGARVAKDSVRVEALGTVDELNAALGWVRAQVAAGIDRVLASVQHDLFDLGAHLADPAATRLPDVIDAGRLEAEIDAFDRHLPPLRRFILPGGAPAAAALHLARTVCRRAERRVVTLGDAGAVRYLNRLSDLLFVLARCANQDANVSDVPWEPRKPS